MAWISSKSIIIDPNNENALSASDFHVQETHFFQGLYGEDAFSAESVGLRVRVSPNHIAAFVALKIPRRNNNNIAFPDPNAPLHFAANTTEPFFAVLALNQNTIETEQFHYYA